MVEWCKVVKCIVVFSCPRLYGEIMKNNDKSRLIAYSKFEYKLFILVNQKIFRISPRNRRPIRDLDHFPYTQFQPLGD